MSWQPVDAPGLAPMAAFCHAAVAGDFVFVSGMVGADAERRLVPGGVGPQMTRALRNAELALRAAGATLADVCKVDVHLAEPGPEAREAMNAAYLEVFGARPPARITTGTTELALGAAVEIDCVAHLGKERR
jgi:enamine deaminase RidA (YjgF/YER057c/UK114 family)